jgi:hypothetical protein
MNISKRIWALVALTTITVFAAGYYRVLTPQAVLAAPGVNPQPIKMPGFPFPAATIDGWIASGKTTAMRQHGWGLWAGLTAITPQSAGLPIYETWYNNTEVQNGPPNTNALRMLQSNGQPTHEFQFPEQFHHRRFHIRPLGLTTGAPVDIHAQVLVTTMFNADYAQSVWSHNYQNPATVWNLQANWGLRPVSQRMIQPFTPPSISLKPAYEFVNGPHHNNGLTTVKYWLGDLTAGPSNSTNPLYPDPTTWKQCVVVNTGTAPNPGNLTCFGTTTKANGMVSVNQFYNYQLTAQDAQTVCTQLGVNPCDIQAGDYAILVGMHVSTKENSNWTWQSFWWNYDQPFPYGAPPSTIPSPFNHYAMCTGYSMTENPPNSPRGTNTQCYNPYLETGLPAPVVGIKSNCMSCHMVASIGNNPNSLANALSPRNSFGYVTFASGTAYLSVWNSADDKVFFDCQTTTDFSWFLANWVQSSTPTSQKPCVLTLMRGHAKKR